MILVTGAAGKTGRAIIQALGPSGESLRALARRESQIESLRALGVQEVVVGDMLNPADMFSAFKGTRAVYHICPNMNPDELRIGQNAIEAARLAGVEHFVFHSVLHPQVQSMPHHWNKLLVEARLFESGLDYTILQPSSYMQNISGYWKTMQADGVYAVPYSIQAGFTMVDLEDVAQAAARVLRENRLHYHAIYELCGAQMLNSKDIARMVTAALGREVQAVALNRKDWEASARGSGMSDYAVRTLLQMFDYYDQHGFMGNGNVLTWLLDRAPTRFEDFLIRLSNSPTSL